MPSVELGSVLLPDEFANSADQPVNTVVDLLVASLLLTNMFSQESVCIAQMAIRLPHEGGYFLKLLLSLYMGLRESHQHFIQLCLVGCKLIEHSDDVLHLSFDHFHTLFERSQVIPV